MVTEPLVVQNTRPVLLRSIGVFTATCVVVANVIGAGIFTTPGFLARDMGSPLALLGIWVLGAILSFAGALSYSELGAAFPEAGGEYVYLREAYGPVGGYLSGWQVVALLALWLLSLIHISGAQRGGKMQVVLTVGKTAAIVALIIFGLALGSGDWGHLRSAPQGLIPEQAFRNVPVSLIFVLYCFSGWNAAAYLAGEIRQTPRTIP